MSKFDAVLIGAFILISMACLTDFWLIYHGYPEFGAGFWTFITATTTGEVVTFSLYRTAKQGGIKQAARTLLNGNKLIEADQQEETDEGQVNQP